MLTRRSYVDVDPGCDVGSGRVLTGPARVACPSMTIRGWAGTLGCIRLARRRVVVVHAGVRGVDGQQSGLAVTALGSVAARARRRFGGLDDVTITTPISGNVALYDGTGWVNSTPAGGGDPPAANNLSDVHDAATAPANLGSAPLPSKWLPHLCPAPKVTLLRPRISRVTSGAVATFNAYGDLSGLPTLGTAAAKPPHYATAAHRVRRPTRRRNPTTSRPWRPRAHTATYRASRR